MFLGKEVRSNFRSEHMSYMSDMPYLKKIKEMSKSWKTLRHLVDWMQVGTDPWRWEHLHNNQEERKERHKRTKVTFIEYQPAIAPVDETIDHPEKLRQVLNDMKDDGAGKSPLRLFVVEDLSQQVIELLGDRFNIDPLFFREQITDTVWYNTRDPWAMPPSLSSSAKRRSWFRLRNLRLQYHTSKEGLENAEKQASKWNVKRRPDDDNNHWNYKDEEGATVSLMRTRTTIWIGQDVQYGNGTVGIILLDPSLKEEGRPLWYGRTNWLPTSGTKKPELSGSWYEDILQMTLSYPWFEVMSSHKIEPQCLTCPTLFTICAEWLVVVDYINARLSQVEWELELPEVFRSKGDVIQYSLKRLLTWRRLLPVLREMVEETLEQSIPAAARLTALGTKNDEEAEVFADVREDFERVKRLLKEQQDRVGRLSDHIDSELSIQNANQSLEENHSLARLSWLATIFIPATFITGLFSMTEDLAAQEDTFKVYFAVALPTTAFIMLFVWFLNSKYWKGWRTRQENKKLAADAAAQRTQLKSKG